MFKMNHKYLATALTVASIVIVSTTLTHARPILGSLTLSSDGVADNGQDLLTRSIFVPENLRTGLRTGDFAAVINGSPITGGTLDLNNLATFSFDVTGAGTFSDIGTGNSIGTRTATNLDVYLLGLFTPAAGGALAEFDASSSSVRFSLTRTGAINDFSISFSGTEAVPPAASPTLVPEPVTLALFASVLFGLGITRRYMGSPHR